jgi:uncharacterized protein YkwD
MSRSVTKIVLLVSAPLLALATLSLIGSRSAHPAVAARIAPINVAFLMPRHAGVNDLGRLDAEAPAPTPTAAAVPAAAARPAQPAPVAARPAPVRPQPKPTPRPVSGVGGAAGAEFSLVNQDRAANGVAGLAWSASLARVAQYRAQDMLNRNYFSHYDPATGQLAFAALLRLWGIPYSTAGENIAWSTNPSMANINTMFMNSPEHRANILKAAYHRVGIGVASNGAKTMVVEVFSN